MVPNLSALGFKCKRHSWKFLDSNGRVVAVLEQRTPTSYAVVATSCHEWIQLAVPIHGVDGVARIELCGRRGVCIDKEAIAIKRQLLATIHNRKLGPVLVHNNYIVGKVHTVKTLDE